MNLELLISKYLDGDLTPEEDQLLRKIIAEEPAAREEFESAALLHVEMQEDAESIVPPVDIVSETEDLIMMKIMNHSVQDSGRPVFFSKLPFGRRLANVFSVAVILLAASIPFKDGSLNIFGTSGFVAQSDAAPSVSEIAGFLNVQGETVAAGSSSFKNSRSKAVRGDERLVQNVAGNTADSFVIDEKSGNEQLPANEIRIPGNIAAITEAIRNSAQSSQNTSALPWATTEPNSTRIQDNTYTPQNEDTKDEVQISTFLATNVLKTASASESAISSISQSISYGISNNDRVGVEMGYTAYAYEGSAMTNVQSSNYVRNDGGGIINDGGGIIIMGAGSDKPVPPGEKSSNKPQWSQQEMPYTDQGRMYWGGAFYERQMVRKGNLSLHGRVGVGGSGEGGLGYGRLFGKFDFLSAFSLTVGAESRAVVKTPASVENPEVSAALSVMYGLQIRF